jgi:tetratricopeptide (TPR) repeat protein
MKYSCKIPVIKILFPVLLFAGVSCTDTEKVLTNVESIVEQQPDSAFHLLNSILFPENLSERMYHKHTLLLLKAKDKSDRDITDDTLIFAAKNYFVRKKNFNDAATAAFYAGRVLHEQGDSEKTLAAYREAETLAENTDDYNLQGLIQGNLSILFHDQRIYKESISREKKAIEMYKKAQNHKNEISALILIGDCFLLENEIDSAFWYYNKSINLADDRKISELQANARQNISVAFWKTGEYPIAKRYLNEALTFNKVDSVEKARIFMNLSKVYTLENNTDSAKFYINKALDFNIRESALLKSSYLSLSEIAEQEGDYEAALQYFTQYNKYVANQVDENKSKALLELNEKYDFEKLKTMNNKRVIQQQSTTIVLFIIILSVSVLAFFCHIKSVRNKKKFLKTKQEIEILKLMADKYSKATEEEIESLKLEAEKQSKDTKEEIKSLKLEAEKQAKATEEEIESLKSEHQKKDNFLAVKIFGGFKIIKLISSLITKQNPDQKELIKFLNRIIYGQDCPDWEILYQTINRLKNGFYDLIREQYNNLETMEFRVCCLSCEDFDDTGIAFILGLTTSMVQRKRSDARKKIDAPPYSNIHAFFIENLKEKGNFTELNTKKS